MAAVIPDDAALRTSLLVFHVALFGDPNLMLQRTGWGDDASQKFDKRYWIRMRQDTRGDSPALSRFLEEFSMSQMFEQHIAQVEARANGAVTTAASTGKRGGGGVDDMGLFGRCCNQILVNELPFTIAHVRRCVAQVLQAEQPGSCDDSHPHALALEVMTGGSSQASNSSVVPSVDRICREARSDFKFSAILRAVWLKLREVRGANWRQTERALSLLHELLLHGPESVLAEAVGHIQDIRVLRTCPVGGKGDPSGMRKLALAVLGLICDTKRLGVLRRAIEKERGGKDHGVEKLAGPRRGLLHDFDTLHAMVGGGFGAAGTPVRAVAPPPPPPREMTHQTQQTRGREMGRSARDDQSVTPDGPSSKSQLQLLEPAGSPPPLPPRSHPRQTPSPPTSPRNAGMGVQPLLSFSPPSSPKASPAHDLLAVQLPPPANLIRTPSALEVIKDQVITAQPGGLAPAQSLSLPLSQPQQQPAAQQQQQRRRQSAQPGVALQFQNLQVGPSQEMQWGAPPHPQYMNTGHSQPQPRPQPAAPSHPQQLLQPQTILQHQFPQLQQQAMLQMPINIQQQPPP
ncbi:unnamed protein product, partial [Chrysoparadoxa australica]